MDDYSNLVRTYIRSKMEDQHMTAAVLAEKSGVPIGTINKVIAGTTPNPTIATIAPLVVSVGGSMDEMLGIEAEGKPTPEIVKICNQRFETTQEALRATRKAVRALAYTVAIFIALFIFLVFYDLFNSSTGYMRSNTMPSYTDYYISEMKNGGAP